MQRRLANEDIVSSPRRAGARAHLRAMGLTERDWSKPLVGIATTWTGTMPCNLNQLALSEQVVASVHKNPLNKHGWITDLLGAGDIDRVIIEWRSLLRQIAHAPEVEWPRWRALQAMARCILNETESPTMTDLPPLAYNQTKRIEHRLVLRRH